MNTTALKLCSLALALDRETVDFLMETEPQTWFQTPHFEGWPAVLVRYEAADDARLSEQIDKAWARRATTAHRSRRWHFAASIPRSARLCSAPRATGVSG